MANDVSIRVTVDNNTARGIAAVNTSLRALRTNATTTGGSLDDLSGRSRSLRSDMDELDGAFTRAGSSMGGLRGSLGSISTSSSSAGGGMDKLTSAAISLAPALIPIASSIAPVIPLAASAGIAVGVFGAALMGQIGAMSDAATAQGKFTDAVSKYGPASKQAGQAEAEYLQSVSKMPPATRTAASALSVLKDQYKSWSNSLAGNTMPVATKAFALLGGTMGKLSPLVKDASTQLSAMMTILAGGVQSSAFDKLISEVENFAHKGLLDATTGLLRFGEALQSGKGQSQIQSFMTYAKANGPMVADTFKNLAQALLNLVKGASGVGVGMLTIVNVLSKLVSAVPPAMISDMMQLAVAIKAVKLAAAGGSAISGMVTAVTAARTAATGATGPLASLTAAFGALSKGAKVAVAGTGIGLLVIALGALSQASKSTPPDVDKLTTSLGKLATTGKVTGEAARAFGTDLGGLGDSLRTLAKPSDIDKTQQSLTRLIGMDSTPVKEAKQNLDAVDKSLASLVQNGHADIAKEAFDQLAKSMQKQGMSASDLRGKLDDYKQAQADAALQAQLAAKSQGLFGEQALQVQKKLDAQKQSADGLRNSIQALNDVNRSALGGMVGFEQAIDDAGKAAKTNAGALTMTHGALDLSSQKARDAASALQDLADKTDGAAASARDSGASWSTVSGIYERGRSNLVKYAMQMGLTKSQANTLANSILKIPNKTVTLKATATDLNTKIKAAQKTVDALKQKRSVAVGANKASLDAQVRAAQAHVNALKQQHAVAIRAVDQTAAAVWTAKHSIASVQSRTVNINAIFSKSGDTSIGFGKATGGIVGGFGHAATGGPRSNLTMVGEQGPELVNLGAGSSVRSHSDTKRALAGGTAGGGTPININLMLDGQMVAQAIFDPLRREIRTRGGNVQATLGRG